jgi:Na+-transporting NADH:ubiquinone oxidoreductase subunit F
MLEIVLSIGVFTALVLGLVALILAVRSRLVVTGPVEITVNDTRRIEPQAGTRLLAALAEAGIFLPSACGGVGTCGQCRVEVEEDVGTPLPIERARIAKRDLDRGTRLACQVIVKGDMAVRVPEEIFGVETWRCEVRANRNVTPLIKELLLDLPEGVAPSFRAGGYVQITCPPYRAKFSDFDIDTAYREEWDRLDLWRHEGHCTQETARAYSLANYPDETGIILLNIRLALPPPDAGDAVPPGVVSSYLFSLKSGDTVYVSGPYGHFFATDSKTEMIFVGGGAGMAPMRAHIFDQLKRLGTTRKIGFWYGARSKRDLFYVEDFDRLQAEHENFRWVAGLSEPGPEDDWTGPTGFIHDILFEGYLKDHPAPETCEYYLCGPPMMLKATRMMLDNLGVDPENIFFDEFGV